MPQFAPGDTKTANLSLPVSPAGLQCSLEVFLTQDGITKNATSGVHPFVSTGSLQDFGLAVVIPSALGNYLARIEVTAGAERIGAYQAVDDVVVAQPQEPPFNMDIVSIVRGTPHLGSIDGYTVNCTISNPNSVVATHSIYLKWAWGTELPSYPHQRWWSFDVGANQYVYAVSLTLNPGQSISIASPMEIELAVYSTWIVNTPLNMTTGGGKNFMLVDELGNQSVPKSVA